MAKAPAPSKATATTRAVQRTHFGERENLEGVVLDFSCLIELIVSPRKDLIFSLEIRTGGGANGGVGRAPPAQHPHVLPSILGTSNELFNFGQRVPDGCSDFV